jgi:tripartite-type tricarboxylate transporter receptor subunit TctC
MRSALSLFDYAVLCRGQASFVTEVTAMSKGQGLRWIRALCLILLCIILAWISVGSAAEKFPSREITILIHHMPGGSLDLASRIAAEYLRKELGVPVVVENRAEAGGVKAVLDVYKGKPDGYTLIATLFPAFAQMEIVYKGPFKLLDLTYLAGFYRSEMLVGVNKDSPYKNLKELIEASKKKSLNCSISGVGTMSHLTAMVLKQKVGVNLEAVPFKALLGGNVDLITVEPLTYLLQKEKVRPLAVFSNERVRNLPDVPTFKELGYDVPPGYSSIGYAGPPGLPEDIRKILSDAFAKALRNPELISKVENMGPTHAYMPGPEYRKVAESFYRMVEEYKDMLVEKK